MKFNNTYKQILREQNLIAKYKLIVFEDEYQLPVVDTYFGTSFINVYNKNQMKSGLFTDEEVHKFSNADYLVFDIDWVVVSDTCEYGLNTNDYETTIILKEQSPAFNVLTNDLFVSHHKIIEIGFEHPKEFEKYVSMLAFNTNVSKKDNSVFNKDFLDELI